MLLRPVVTSVLFLLPGLCLAPAGAGAQALIARVETGSNPHAITVDESRGRVYVANHYAGTVSVIDAATNVVTMTIPIMRAWDVALNAATGRLYVSADASQLYFVHDADTGAWLASVSAPRWARAIAVNTQSDRVYVSNTYDNVVRVFDGTTHHALAVAAVSNWLSDLAVDADRNLVYAANYGNGSLTVIDGATNAVVTEVTPGSSGNSWAVAVNARTNKIYLTKLNTVGGGQLIVLDRGSLATLKTITLDGAAGVAVNERTNRVYVTLYGQGMLAVIDGATDTVANYVRVGGQWPERVAVHTDLGRVYVTDGFTTNTISVFQDVVPNSPPLADAGPDQAVECAGSGCASVTLDGSASSDPDGDSLSFEWRDAKGSVIGAAARLTLDPPLGEHIFTLTVSDPEGARSSDTVTIVVRDTTPPVVSSAAATPSILWPPNGQMVSVAVNAVVSDACDANASCRIAGVRSSETPVVRGAGSRAPDGEIAGPMSVRLRAERSGTGLGRTYTIALECRDASGNVTSREVEVLVPHDRR